MFALICEISLRHWRRAPLRSVLVALGIGLGVALYVATGATSNTILAAFTSFARQVSTRADLTVIASGEGVPNDLIGTIGEVPGVAHVAASVSFSAQAPALGDSVMVLGVDLLGDLYFLPYQTDRGERLGIDPLAFVNDPTAILVGNGFAQRHSLCEGSHVQLLTAEGPKTFTVYGTLAEAGPASAFGNDAVVMFLDAAQMSFAKGQLADRIDIAIAEDADLMTVRDAVTSQLGPSYRVEPPEEFGAQLRQLVKPVSTALLLSGLLALIVGGFLVYNAVGVSVAQRRHEIGVLRALGVTRAKTVLLFAAEASALAVPGVLLGLWFGSFLAHYAADRTLDSIDRLYISVSRSMPQLSSTMALRGAAVGLLTALFASYLPARRGAAAAPAEVLRGMAYRPSQPKLRPALSGAGALVTALAFLPQRQDSLTAAGLAVGALVLGPALATPSLILGIRRVMVPVVDRLLGVPGRLGLDYVTRALGQSTVNVMALAVAVGMSVSVGGWLSSFEQAIVSWSDRVGLADLTVTMGSPLIDRRHVPLTWSMAERITALPGIRATQMLRIQHQTIAGQRTRLVATDLEVFRREAERMGKGWTVLAGEPLGPGELDRKPLALLSGNAAKRLNLSVGDTIRVKGSVKTTTFTVRAIILDYTSDTGAVFIDRGAYVEGWGDTAVDSVMVYLENGTDQAAVRERIKAALGGTESLFVTNSAAIRKSLIDTLNDSFSYSQSFEIVTLVIALMSIIGTMTAAIINRTRELAMLRAVGATTRQVAASIVSEAGFLGFCAALIGVAVGALQCHLLLETFLGETGFHIELAFPWAASMRIASLVTLTSAAAGGLAAARAVRTDVAGALMRA